MKKINIKGFTHIEMLIVIVVIVALGFVGFRIMKTSQAGNTCSGQNFGFYNESRGYGSSGACVKDIQQLVNSLSGSKLTVDGLYGPLTKTAVLNFQKTAFAKDSTQWDGIVGAKTWSKLCTLTPTNSSTSFTNVQKSACTTPSTSTAPSTPSTSTTSTTKTTVSSYMSSSKFTAFKTIIDQSGLFAWGEAKTVTLVKYNINTELSSMLLVASATNKSLLDPISTLQNYPNKSQFTNVNNRNNGGGKAQNWSAIGVSSSLCYKNKNCTQGVLTIDQAYQLACGSLYPFNPVSSVHSDCISYKNDWSVLNTFYDLVGQYNISAQPLVKANSTVLTPTEISSLDSSITKITNGYLTYIATVKVMSDNSKNLKYDILNKLNGNDYLNAYIQTNKGGFCAVYHLDRSISGTNYSGNPINVYSGAFRIDNKVYNGSLKADCKKLGTNPTGYDTVWWNNAKPVAAYGW